MRHELPDFASTRHLPYILNPSAITRLDAVATKLTDYTRAVFKVDSLHCYELFHSARNYNVDT